MPALMLLPRDDFTVLLPLLLLSERFSAAARAFLLSDGFSAFRQRNMMPISAKRLLLSIYPCQSLPPDGGRRRIGIGWRLTFTVAGGSGILRHLRLCQPRRPQ